MASVNEILKVKDLLPGSYLIESYEPTKSSYGINYLVCAENESKEQLKFWSNGFLTDFISSRKPTRKFKIEYVNSKITIPGYSRKVILN
jgi:hypothetical protein